MKHLTTLILTLVIATGLPGFCEASAPAGATFLEIDPSPRSSSLGEAYTAVADDVFGMLANPAASSRLTGLEVGVGYLKLFEKINISHLGVSIPVFDRFSLGGNFTFLGFDDVRRDENGVHQGNLDVREFQLSLNVSARITEDWFVGGNVKWVREDFDQAKGNTAAFDIGTQYRIPFNPEYGDLYLGAAVRNIGPDIKIGNAENDLPLILAAGISYRVWNSLLVTAEYQDQDNGVFSLGTEYVWEDMVAIRVGGRFDSGQENESRFRIGMGLNSPIGIFDYSFENLEGFDGIHRISYRIQFGAGNRGPVYTEPGPRPPANSKPRYSPPPGYYYGY